MKKLPLVIAVVALLVAGGVLLRLHGASRQAATACLTQEQSIRDALAQANHCAADADCSAITACPFGCYVPVHVDEEPRLRALVRDYGATCERCMYKCRGPGKLVCTFGRCAVTYPP